MIGLLSGVALAGSVFVNGQQVDPAKLSQVRLPQAEVIFDANGGLFIMAPGFEIPSGALWSAAPAPASMATPQASPTPPPANLRPQTDNGVPRARYWLATEDNGSAGHVLEVSVNGVSVISLRSGEPVRIMDLGPHLRLGENAIRVKSTSTDADGGSLYLYVGTGSDQAGTVSMDAPDIQFGVGKSRVGTYERTYTLEVAR